MTPQRYDLKQWWSKVTNRPYEKFIPWSGIAIWTNSGLDPKLKDQVIFQMKNVNRMIQNLHEQNLSIPDNMRPNVDNEFRLSSKFISSNRCERMAILEDKYEKYHNFLEQLLKYKIILTLRPILCAREIQVHLKKEGRHGGFKISDCTDWPKLVRLN